VIAPRQKAKGQFAKAGKPTKETRNNGRTRRSLLTAQGGFGTHSGTYSQNGNRSRLSSNGNFL
jgi:hypothetical protein